MGAVLTYRRAQGGAPLGALQTVRLDDALFVAEGKFSQVAGITSWPGGLYQNTVTVSNNVQVGDPLTQLTLPILHVTGRAEEGFDVCGAQEDTGPVEFWLRALQGPNLAWQKVFDNVGSGVPYLVYLGGGAPGELSSAVFRSDAPPAGYQPQSYFNRMHDAMLYVRNLPAGKYQPRLVKKPNAAAGDTSTGDRGSYLDSLILFSDRP